MITHFSRFAARTLFVLGLVFWLSACTTTTNMRDSTDASKAIDQAFASPKKLLVMPLDVELSLLTASGITEPKAEWTQQAKDFIQAALDDILVEKGHTMDLFSSPSDDPNNAIYQMEKLHQATGMNILIHDIGPVKLPSHKGKTISWTLGEDVRQLHEQTGADYALFVYIRDSYTSGGRAALMFVGAIAGVGVTGGSQAGFASLVDLRSGDIVWFNRLLSSTGDLREAEPARKTVSTLLADFPGGEG